MSATLVNPHIILLSFGITVALIGIGVYGLVMAYKEFRRMAEELE
jgi:hypothetical protein